jgi:uncharacterized protein (TIGR02646 family)
MKYIQKKQAPRELETWKKTYIAKNGNTLEDLYVQADMTGKKIWKVLSTPEFTSDGTPRVYSKEALKMELVKEQGFICCYCNRKINLEPKTADKVTIDDVTIEHFKPKGMFFSLTYDYNNLFASCDGFVSEPKPRDTCCNIRRVENELLPLCPTDIDIERHFAFTIDGQIEGLTNEGNEMIQMLGLNIQKLNQEREAAISAYLYEYPDEESLFPTIISKEKALIFVEALKKTVGGQFIPFCVAIIKVLENEVIGKAT